MGNKIVICGKRSRLGRAFSDYMKKQGYDVEQLSEDDLNDIPAPRLTKYFEGCLAVCNTIGVPYVAKWSDRYVHDIYCSRMLSIRAVINALTFCKERPKVMIQLSNAMVYDQFEVHDDFSTQYGDSFIAEVGQMETKEALKLCKKLPDVRLVIVRCGYIMGKNGGMFPLMKKLFRRKIGGYVGDGYQCIPMVHVDDAVRAGEMLVCNENASGIYNLSIPEMASLRELSEAFVSRDNGFHIPLMNFFVKLMTGRAISLFEQNCKVEPTRIKQLGFEFKYPNVESIVSNLY